MRLFTDNDVLDETVRRLCKALRTLNNTTDRPIARRSARRRSLTALRLVRAAMDREFPAIKKSREGVKRLTPEGRVARMKRKGWQTVNTETAGAYAACGITVKRIAWTTREKFQRGFKNGVPRYRLGEPEEHELLFVPAWARAIGLEPSRLRAAKKSRKTQQAALTVHALKDET